MFRQVVTVAGRLAVDAYTNFPNYCCRCLQPNPQGTWEVKNSQSQQRENGAVLVREVSVQVPLCGSCGWALRLHDLGTVGAAFSVAGLALAWWYWDTPDLAYLPYGVGLAIVVFFVVLIVLACTVGPSQVAHLEPDGSDITFANPEYQRLYTGESRPGRQGQGDWRANNWR
jgi:hypothetical protein